LDTLRLYMLAWQSLTYLHLGRWNEAAAVGSQVLPRRSASAINRIPALLALGRLHARRGDSEPHSALDEALELATPTGTLQHIGLVRGARAEAAWHAGDRERALEEARAAYDLALSKKHPWIAGELAFWRWRSGEKVFVPAWTAKPFALQIAGDWRAAADEWERLSCPYEQARALADGDAAACAAALKIYERLGARAAAEALKRALRAEGVPVPRGPRPTTRENPFGLTARQVDILRLLTADLSNSEIAARLHISPKTADHHVSAVLAKLDVHSREAAAALARNHPLLHPK
ncbi:MAG TPA: LuxR C-terminal-related transcriptional regulator, partial [Ardenticatenaceae bacterium]|nr:LuxR C-terminal-related transcriptional regulator [Ardenticatenaceae bacterium]